VGVRQNGRTLASRLGFEYNVVTKKTTR
jgi:hypothetical protein